MINEAFIQDEHLTISALFGIKPIGLYLKALGGYGFNNTYAADFWMNNFYKIFSTSLEYFFLKKFSVGFKFSTFDFFVFDGFPCPRFSIYFLANLTKNLSSKLETTLRYTSMDVVTHNNSQIDHVDFKATLKYKF